MEHFKQSTTEKHITSNDTEPANVGMGFESQGKKQGATHLMAPGPSAVIAHIKSPPYLGDSPADELLHNMHRPTKIGYAQFTTGSTSVILQHAVTPTVTVQYGANFNLFGSAGFRATLCYRVEVAAAPQAQGLVKMAWLPLHQFTTYSRDKYRACASSMHSADINLAEGSSAELRVPFCYDRDFWYLNGGAGNAPIGTLSVFPYGAVAWDTTTVSTPSVTLYFWLEDIETVGKGAVLTVLTPQGMGDEMAHPKVSAWFKAASDVAVYASSIPSLTYIAAPLGWAFGAASKIAAHFGWSKPFEGSPGGYMHMGFGRGINTCVDADLLQPLGYYANNAIKVLPGFAGNDIDEMSICSITCRPGLIASFEWKAADNSNVLKWTCPVTPSAFVFQSSTAGFAQQSVKGLGSTATSGNFPGFIPSPIAFVGALFAKWRGDIIFRFRFTRTKFHSGRILIGYCPYDSPWDGSSIYACNLAPDPSGRLDYHSVIVDLRTTSEVDFTVPYTYNTAYCDTGMHQFDGAPGSVASTGVVFARVIDPLYGPDNVMSHITVLVEVLGTCGLEFSQPCTNAFIPLSTSTSPVLTAQAMDDDFEAAATTSGERILSLKQILMRPTWYYNKPNTYCEYVQTSFIDYYQPAVFGGAGPVYKPQMAGDATIRLPYTVMSYVSSLFGLVRGSVVHRAMPTMATSSDHTSFKVSFYFSDGVDASWNAQGALSMEHNTANMVSIPYYGRHNRTRTGWAAGSMGQSTDINRKFLYSNVSGVDSPSLFGSAAGDDYQLGLWCGVPPCVIRFNASYGVLDPYFNIFSRSFT